MQLRESTMTAVVQRAYGVDAGAVLELGEAPVPEPGAGEVLVRVAAASVDMGTWHLMAGRPYPVRLAGFGVRRPKLLNPAMSVAGAVAAVGPGVTGLAVGEEVFGVAPGALAPFAVGKAAKLVPAPAGLTPEEAAALPISGLTALQAVRDHARPRAGERALVTGASGGVGSLAVQLLAAAGAEVTASCSGPKAEFVRSLGAAHVVDRTRQDPMSGGPYDMIVDIAGHAPIRRLRAALAPGGRAVVVGSETGGAWLGGTDRALRAVLLRPFLRDRTVRAFVSAETAADLTALREEVAAGRLRPPVDRVYPLAEAAEAIAHVAAGRARGKVVVRV